MPWRAVEAMHWQIGAQGMADRAGVAVFSTHPSATPQTFIKTEPGLMTNPSPSHLAPPVASHRRSSTNSPHEPLNSQTSYTNPNAPQYQILPQPAFQAQHHHQPQYPPSQQTHHQPLPPESDRSSKVLLAPKNPPSAFPDNLPHERDISRPQSLTRHMSQPNMRGSRNHTLTYPPLPDIPRRPSPTHGGPVAPYDGPRLPPIPASGGPPGIDDDRPRLPPLRLPTVDMPPPGHSHYSGGSSPEEFRHRRANDTYWGPSSQTANSRLPPPPLPSPPVPPPPPPPPSTAGRHPRPPSPTRRQA